MYKFWFEVKHVIILWQSYVIYLLLLPLLLAATLVMLHTGLVLQQQAMAPMPPATASSANGFWSLGLQDDNFQTSAFNPSQRRQLSTALASDYQLASLAVSTLSVKDPVHGIQKLSALFLDNTVANFWPEARFIEQLAPDKVLLSHSYAKQLLNKGGTLPEMLEIDGLFFQVVGIVPVDWVGIGHWQADLWFDTSASTTLLRQRLQKQYQSLPMPASDLAVLLPSLLDVTAQFYLLIKHNNAASESDTQLRSRLEQLALSTENNAMVGPFSIKITQRPQTLMLLPGVQYLPAKYQKTLEMSRLLLAQASLLLLLTSTQLIILLLARHLQRRAEWRIRTMLGLPQQQTWYAMIAELLPVLALTVLFYTLLMKLLGWFISGNPSFSHLSTDAGASWFTQSTLFTVLLILVFVMMLLLQKIITHYLTEMSGDKALQFSALLQRGGSIIMTVGACFSLSLCLLNWQSLQQLTANPYINASQQDMHIYALQQAPAGYYRSLAEDIRTQGIAVTLSSAAPLSPITEFYVFTLANSTRDPAELALIHSDHLAAEVLGLKLISGRWFSEFAHNECVISNHTLQVLGAEIATVLNRTLLNELPVIGHCEIVGVVDDLQYGYLNEPIAPVVYKPFGGFAEHFYMLSHDPHLTKEFQETNSHPAAGIAEAWPLKSLMLEQSARERYFFRLTLLLSVFTIILYLGSLAVEQKLLAKRLGKETAIRAALGAGTYQLTVFLIGDPLKTLSITLLILTLLLTLTLQQVDYFSLSPVLIVGNLWILLMCLSTIVPLLLQIRRNEMKVFIQ